MDEKAAIGFILQKVNAMDARTGYGLGEPGMATIKNVAQHDANKAVAEFMQNHDPGPLLQVIAAMHAYGAITDDEYNQLTTSFSKEI